MQPWIVDKLVVVASAACVSDNAIVAAVAMATAALGFSLKNKTNRLTERNYLLA